MLASRFKLMDEFKLGFYSLNIKIMHRLYKRASNPEGRAKPLKFKSHYKLCKVQEQSVSLWPKKYWCLVRGQALIVAE